MNILVLAAGVADPRRPLESVTASPAEARAANPIVLSPFDEAALEIALQIRDKRPGAVVNAILLGGRESEATAQKLAAYRLDGLVRLDVAADAMIDTALLANALGEAIRTVFSTPPQLVLIGREFGDYDSGAMPALLAANLSRPSFTLVQGFRIEGDSVVLFRERAHIREEVEAEIPLVASVTNDRSNRLRHPLMKNVMEAKRSKLPVTEAPLIAKTITLSEMRSPPSRSAAGKCRLLSGSVDDQVAAMATFLSSWRSKQ